MLEFEGDPTLDLEQASPYSEHEQGNREAVVRATFIAQGTARSINQRDVQYNRNCVGSIELEHLFTVQETLVNNTFISGIFEISITRLPTVSFILRRRDAGQANRIDESSR